MCKAPHEISATSSIYNIRVSRWHSFNFCITSMCYAILIENHPTIPFCVRTLVWDTFCCVLRENLMCHSLSQPTTITTHTHTHPHPYLLCRKMIKCHQYCWVCVCVCATIKFTASTFIQQLLDKWKLSLHAITNSCSVLLWYLARLHVNMLHLKCNSAFNSIRCGSTSFHASSLEA